LVSFVNADGDLALVRGSWTALAKKPDGSPTRISGKNVELVRRQADSTWRFVIDHPRAAD
jgi:ketosteroid isomerase-like protein